MNNYEKTDFLRQRCFRFMTAYQTDLIIDTVSMTQSGDYPFIHTTRKTGTDIVVFSYYGKNPDVKIPYLFSMETPRNILINSISLLKDYTNGKHGECLFHYYNGNTVEKIDSMTVLSICDTEVNKL